MTVVFETAAVRAARGEPMPDLGVLLDELTDAVQAAAELVTAELDRYAEAASELADTFAVAIQTEAEALATCPPGSTGYRRRLHRIATAARELYQIAPRRLRRALARLITAALIAAAQRQCAAYPRPVRRLRTLTYSTACLSRGPPLPAVVRPLSSSLSFPHSSARSRRKGRGAVSRVT